MAVKTVLVQGDSRQSRQFLTEAAISARYVPVKDINPACTSPRLRTLLMCRDGRLLAANDTPHHSLVYSARRAHDRYRSSVHCRPVLCSHVGALPAATTLLLPAASNTSTS